MLWNTLCDSFWALLHGNDNELLTIIGLNGPDSTSRFDCDEGGGVFSDGIADGIADDGISGDGISDGISGDGISGDGISGDGISDGFSGGGTAGQLGSKEGILRTVSLDGVILRTLGMLVHPKSNTPFLPREVQVPVPRFIICANSWARPASRQDQRRTTMNEEKTHYGCLYVVPSLKQVLSQN